MEPLLKSNKEYSLQNVNDPQIVLKVYTYSGSHCINHYFVGSGAGGCAWPSAKPWLPETNHEWITDIPEILKLHLYVNTVPTECNLWNDGHLWHWRQSPKGARTLIRRAQWQPQPNAIQGDLGVTYGFIPSIDPWSTWEMSRFLAFIHCELSIFFQVVIKENVDAFT